MSPAVSKAQFKKMIELYEEGKITKAQLDNFVSVEYNTLPRKKRKKNVRPKKSSK